jgi:hypothetical protein
LKTDLWKRKTIWVYSLKVRLSFDYNREFSKSQPDNELDEREKILNWLSQIDFASKHYDIITRCEPGTGQWLLDSTEFHLWLASKKQTLFCPGIPGAGKTMQTSILVKDLIGRFEDNTTVGVAYIYCNFQSQQDQKPEQLLANLIKQLIRRQETFPRSVEALYKRYRKINTRPLLQELSEVFQSLGKSYSRLFIVVDALDECEDTDSSRTKLLDHLLDAQSKIGLNIFATSRFVPEISKKFEGCLSKEIRPSPEDVYNVLNRHMTRLPDFVASDIALQNEIKREIELAVEGMYV